MDDKTTLAQTAYAKMVLGAVHASCEFSLFVSRKNHSDLSLTACFDQLKQFYKKKSGFQQQKMLTLAMAKVDEKLARESHQLKD